MAKIQLYGLTLEDLKDKLKDFNEKPFRAKQIYDWTFVKRVNSFEEMSNLSKSLREVLTKNFELETLTLVDKYESKDGTSKFLFKLNDGNVIETVLMKHNYGNSVCVTTQVGCKMGCSFCASTIGGLKRNLTTSEIVAQVMQVQKYLDETSERVSHVVIMGIGEPFDNFDNTMKFIDIINSEDGLKIGARHITVSTSGLVPKIYEFADLNSQVSLAISLHAPNDEVRTKLMPVNRKFPITELMKAVRYYVNKTNRRITFEYGLINGVNDNTFDAKELANLVKGLNCHVNLIPINYVKERKYKQTPKDSIKEYVKVLENAGINVTVRREHGSDIEAACGQLRAKHENLV